MILYQRIKDMSIDQLAQFITTLIDETEDKMLYKLAEYGIEASIARPAPEFRIANNLALLLSEVDDADT